MSPRKTDARERMILSTVALLKEHSADAVSVDRVLAHSGAPRGSVYHHFPGGRTQLLDEAVAHAGAYLCKVIQDAAARSGDPVQGVDAFFGLWRTWLVESDFRAGCPILSAVGTDNEAFARTRSALDALAHWEKSLADLIAEGGLPARRSRQMAAFIIAAAEGAVAMCRAERSINPLDGAAAEVRDHLSRALRKDPGPQG
ncbi:TetR/AcrR family transcriptional regulator [Streptomyces sp. NPDC087659]|uniref:TetR/AcrR family transcriptional regulator n=1 Tax=Streptomyces sp. NPDC087659 TaxID=3365801 RepID=UPI0038283BA0